MKKILIAVLIASTLLYSCKAKDAAAAADAKDATKTEAADAAAPAAEKPAKPATKADIAYAFGVAIGTSIKETGVEIDYSAFVKGMKDTMESKKAKVTVEEAGSLIQGALMEAQAKKAVAAAAEEAKFFEENGKKAGVTPTASGLQFEVMKPSDGAKPVAANTVKVDYVGTLLNGTTFDSSITRGEPAVFPLEGVIGRRHPRQLHPRVRGRPAFDRKVIIVGKRGEAESAQFARPGRRGGNGHRYPRGVVEGQARTMQGLSAEP